MDALDLNTIVQYDFPDNQYAKDIFTKKQIFLHHTAGNPSAIGVFDYWKTNDERVATCVVIAGKSKNTTDGQIVQGFSSKYWAYHLGLQSELFKKYNIPYQSLDHISIAIEICNWGQLTKTDRGFETYVGTTVPESDVVYYDNKFRGFNYFHKYSNAQIDSVAKLLTLWGKTYGIPLAYKGDEIFDIDVRALKGTPGVFTHCSVRADKSDLHPQAEVITMLKSL